MFYCVTATAVETMEGGTMICHQVPTFFLNADVQGIVNAEGAETAAKRIINPSSNPRIKVNCCISSVLDLD